MTDFLSQVIGRPVTVRASVLQHIQYLLHQRLGGIGHLPDYGMPELQDQANLAELKKNVVSGLKTLIEKYEPRVTGLRIEDASIHQESNRLQLKITAFLFNDDTLCFEAFLMNNHQLYIQKNNEFIYL
tara:strand:- start:2568 stop:2951 length:384 start_codon:yes stop_codon:yes gene_type:complete